MLLVSKPCKIASKKNKIKIHEIKLKLFQMSFQRAYTEKLNLKSAANNTSVKHLAYYILKHIQVQRIMKRTPNFQS